MLRLRLRYLSSGLIYGIGPITAQKIVDKFGLDTLDIIEFNPERLVEVNGVSKVKAEEICKSFSQIKMMQQSVMFLQEYGISTNLSVKIYNQYKDKTISTVQTNPYVLVEDIDGVGFLTADRIAANGDTANKIGTYTVAIAAKYHNVPFYIAAPLSTIDTSIATGAEIPIEERSHEEVTHINGKIICSDKVNVINPGFDVTPNELIAGIITEKGILRPDYKKSIAELFAK